MTEVVPAAVSFGETMAVFLADDDLPIRSASHFRLTAAGSESNVMAALAVLGHRARFATRIGDDGLGVAVVRRLRALGVEVHAVTDRQAPTGVLVRDHPADAHGEVCYARAGSAATRLTWDDICPVLDPEPRLFFLSGITPVLSAQTAEVAHRVLNHLRDRATTVVFDPNLRRKLMPEPEAVCLLKPLLEHADIVIAGDDELSALTGIADYRRAARRLLDSGARTVIAKRGGQGAYGADTAGEYELRSLARHVVDPVGAGDAFAAGFMSGVLRELSLADAMTEASAVAAHVVSTRGDTEGLPTSAERDKMTRTRERHRADVSR
jgi:2-dehydro-3-deoxygluconokinase